MTENRFYQLVLLFLVIVLGYLTYNILSPFLSPIMWAIVLSVVFYPVYAYILKYVKFKPLASFLTLILIFFVLFGPFSYFSYLLTQETVALVNRFQNGNEDLFRGFLKHPIIDSLVQKLLVLLHMTEEDFDKAIMESILKLGKESTGILKAGFSNIVAGAVNLVFMLLSIFFFLEDGPAFISKLESFMPFSKKQRDRLINQTKDIVVSTIYGGVGTAPTSCTPPGCRNPPGT